jgi:hypothetical protein
MEFSLNPINETMPLDGTSRPAQSPRRVVFPLPEGPMIESVLPGFTLKLTLSRTVKVPEPDLYDLVNPSVCRTISDMIFDYQFLI